MVSGRSVLRSPALRSRPRGLLPTSLIGAAVVLAATSASAGVPPTPVVHGRIVVQQGDTPTDGPNVASVNTPFVNAAGTVGFDGMYNDGDHYVWVDDGVVWSGSDDMNFVFTDLETRMDSDGMGHWVYPIDGNGLDGLYSDAGPFAFAGDATADPMDGNYTYLGNTSMNSDGSFYWVSGVQTMSGGFNALYYSADGTPDSATLVIAGGDTLDMVTLDPQGVDFDYAVSEDGAHVMTILVSNEGFGQNNYVRVDDGFVAHQSDDTGDGDAWQTFDLVSINAAGNYVFTGNTNGPTATNEYIAYNGTIALREGDTVAGVVIGNGSELRFVSITDDERLAFAWANQTPMGFRESVFLACDASDPASADLVFTTIDFGLDVDDDDMPDYQIDDVLFGAPTTSRTMGASDFIYVPVALNDGMVTTDAMIEVPVTCCGNGNVDGGEECDDGNDVDTDDCLSTCVAASCGDGIVWDGMEGCDDGNGDDTDDCPGSCQPATCGDGYVWADHEECDDGNTDDGDGCASDCTMEASVDESGGGGTGGADGTSGGGSGGNSGSATNSGGNPPPVTTAGLETGTGSGTGDTESGGEATDSGGCGCRSTEPAPPALFGLVVLGLLGLRRRR